MSVVQLYVDCSLRRKPRTPGSSLIRDKVGRPRTNQRQHWAVHVSELSRDIQALAGDLARLQTEIERFRTELRAALDRFLNEQPGKTEGTAPLPGCSHAPPL